MDLRCVGVVNEDIYIIIYYIYIFIENLIVRQRFMDINENLIF